MKWPSRKKKQSVVIPPYTAAKLCKCLEKLGFEKQKAGKHQHKYKHPTIKAKAVKPFVIVPTSIGKDKTFQETIIKQISKGWEIELDEIIKHL